MNSGTDLAFTISGPSSTLPSRSGFSFSLGGGSSHPTRHGRQTTSSKSHPRYHSSSQSSSLKNVSSMASSKEAPIQIQYTLSDVQLNTMRSLLDGKVRRYDDMIELISSASSNSNEPAQENEQSIKIQKPNFTLTLHVTSKEETSETTVADQQNEKSVNDTIGDQQETNKSNTFSFSGMDKVLNSIEHEMDNPFDQNKKKKVGSDQSSPPSFHFSFSPQPNLTLGSTTHIDISSTPSPTVDEQTMINCTIVNNNEYSWSVHSEILTMWMPAHFSATARLMGIDDSFVLDSELLEYDISPRNMKQMIDFMYSGCLTIYTMEDTLKLVTLSDYFVFHTLRNLLLEQIESRVTFNSALFYLSWCGRRSDNPWRTLAERCITEITRVSSMVVTEISNGNIPRSLFRDISFDKIYSLLRSIDGKNMYYIRWCFLQWWMQEAFEVNLSEHKYMIMEVFLEAYTKLLALLVNTKIPMTVCSEVVSDGRKRKAMDEIFYSTAHNSNVSVESSSDPHDQPHLVEESQDISALKRTIFEEMNCPPELIDLLCQGNPMEWNFIITDVIINEIAHCFYKEREQLIVQDSSVIDMVLSSDLLQVKSEDDVVDFLMDWYSRADEEEKEMVALKLFSTVRYFHISLPCINHLCTSGMKKLLNHISPNMLRNVLEFRVSNLETKVNRETSSQFGRPRRSSEWTDIQMSNKHQKRTKKPSRSAHLARSYKTVEEEDSQSESDDDMPDSVSYLSDYTRVEVLDLMLSMFTAAKFSSERIVKMIEANKARDRRIHAKSHRVSVNQDGYMNE